MMKIIDDIKSATNSATKSTNAIDKGVISKNKLNIINKIGLKAPLMDNKIEDRITFSIPLKYVIAILLIFSKNIMKQKMTIIDQVIPIKKRFTIIIMFDISEKNKTRFNALPKYRESLLVSLSFNLFTSFERGLPTSINPKIR